MRRLGLLLGGIGLVVGCTRHTPTLNTGIYYRLPNTQNQQGVFTGYAASLSTQIAFVGGYDAGMTEIVYTDNDKKLTVEDFAGNKVEYSLTGIFQAGRPSFSPDRGKVVVQARETGNEGQTENIDIFVVTLSNRQAKKIGALSVNEEFPQWFPTTNKIVYASFDPVAGVDWHVYDLDAGAERYTVDDVLGSHIAVSKDSSRLLAPTQLKIYNAENGTLVSDIRSTVLSGLTNAGYEVDTRFTGQANAGLFPLSGSFSPDGTQLVLDGAVKKGNDYLVLVFVVDINGANFQVLKEITTVDPSHSNNHNFSLVQPLWL